MRVKQLGVGVQAIGASGQQPQQQQGDDPAPPAPCPERRWFFNRNDRHFDRLQQPGCGFRRSGRIGRDIQAPPVEEHLLERLGARRSLFYLVSQRLVDRLGEERRGCGLKAMDGREGEGRIFLRVTTGE